MRVRNNLQAEVTLVNKNDGTASIYSLVFPDVVLRGLCAGAVTLHLVGRGTIRLRDAEENTALELVFGARRRLPGKRGMCICMMHFARRSIKAKVPFYCCSYIPHIARYLLFSMSSKPTDKQLGFNTIDFQAMYRQCRALS